MYEKRKQDVIISWTMIVLNVLPIILVLIPGFIQMYDQEQEKYVSGCLWKIPAENVMKSMAPVLILLFSYCLILTICYFRSQSVNTCKAVMVFAFAACIIALMALMPDNTILTMPYIIVPALFFVLGILSIVRFVMEQKRFDALMDS